MVTLFMPPGRGHTQWQRCVAALLVLFSRLFSRHGRIAFWGRYRVLVSFRAIDLRRREVLYALKA
jgi:hypothetical protein